MNCKSCGFENAEHARFCSECGSTIQIGEVAVEAAASTEPAKAKRSFDQILFGEDGNPALRKAMIAVIIGLMAAVAFGLGFSDGKVKSAGSSESTVSSSTDAGIDKAELCDAVSTTYNDYKQEFADFRYGPSDTSWDVLFELSDRAVASFNEIAAAVEKRGISWDSAPIVSSMISSAAAGIQEISDSSRAQFFPAGRDLQTVLDEVDFSIQPVINSSCYGTD